MSGRIRYRVTVMSTAGTSGGDAFVLQTSQLKEAPTLGGQNVRAAEGKVESMAWKLKVLDANSTFTSHLANTSGQLKLLGRQVKFQSSLDSTGTYNTLTVGRLTDINLGSDIASWDLTINDERY